MILELHILLSLEECLNFLQLHVTQSPFKLVVTILSIETMTLSEASLLCPLTILNMDFKVDIICIPLTHLQVILEMDYFPVTTFFWIVLASQ